MPRLPNVTIEELDKAEACAFADSQLASDLARRIEQGYCTQILEPLKLASAYLVAASAFSDLARLMVLKAALGEQERQIEATLRARHAPAQ
jgi:hypothetical protein